MKFEIVQFLLTITENACYTVAGVVSCFLEKSPCIPMLRGDHVPVPIANLYRKDDFQERQDFGTLNHKRVRRLQLNMMASE
jgi:hypothetical protein